MNIEELRGEFECCVKSINNMRINLLVDPLGSRDGDHYLYPSVEVLWQGFQAHAALQEKRAAEPFDAEKFIEDTIKVMDSPTHKAFVAQYRNGPPPLERKTKTEAPAVPDETMTLKEVWKYVDGNESITPSRQVVINALKIVSKVAVHCEENHSAVPMMDEEIYNLYLISYSKSAHPKEAVISFARALLAANREVK